MVEILTDTQTKKRPAFVPKSFAGACQCFPETDAFFLAYQKAWIKDKALMKIMEKSRRIGVTFGTSYELVQRHAPTEADAAQWDSWVSSKDEITAKEFILYCSKFSRMLDAGAKDMGLQLLDDGKQSARVIAFANGTRINGLTSNPDAFVGKGGRVRHDEFAIRDNPRDVYDISMPCIDWGGDMGIISTHRGSANFFNELIREILEKGNPKNFSHHRVTLQDALDQGFLYKLQSKLRPEDPRMQMDEADYFNYQRNRCSDEEQFLQEYMCVPGDDASAFLPYDLIASCEYRRGEEWETPLDQCEGQLYVGVDVGREHDLTVIWVVEKFGGVYFTRQVIELHKERFADQETELYQILQLGNVRRCCIDNTGIGRQFAERAQERFGKYKVEPVNFTGPVKEELAYPFRAAFEDRNIRIPYRDGIRADLRSIKKETTAAGNIRFAADRGTNGHADRFWAAALALHAGAQATTPALPASFRKKSRRSRAQSYRKNRALLG
jgi:phage FluMu gp28-like protein